MRAALAVSALALAIPLLPVPPPAACPVASERAADGGHTRAVSCGEGAPLRGPARLLFGLGLDPNHADAATLEVLPGIGPSRAAAIVAARCERPFTRAADLTRVRGIGPATSARLAPHLSVGAEGEALVSRQCE